jgi:pilus assembly protein Flp/PilA
VLHDYNRVNKKTEKILGGGFNMLMNFKNKVVSVLKKEEGQGMVEYALLVGLIAVVVIAALVLLGPAIKVKFDAIVTSLK